MKNKVKPNKKAYVNRFIQDYQKEVKQEKGITLIALIVMVIILIILVAIVINGVTGDEGILVSTETAAENYIIEQYREQIQQLAQSIIIKDSILGKVTTVTSMAEDMEEESWIKSAEPNESTKDIIVTTTDGYVYQVYYDNETGELNVEYIGRDDGSSIPTIIASYDKDTSTINAEAYCDDGIAKIELIYKGEVVQDTSSSTANFKVSATGWYQVKATSSKGISRSTWVRVTGKLTAPTIVVTSSGEEENGWYGKDNVPVVVTISTDSETAVGIYYKTNLDDEYTYVLGKSTTYEIEEAGRIVIYAYVVDSNEDESDISNLEIKYDNIAPEVGTPAVSPEASESGWYTTDVIISLPNMTDANSGVAGYYYWKIGDEENKTYVSDTSTTITVASEGITTIGFQAKDYAGNLSEGTTTLTVQKDSVPPNAFTPEITNKTSTGFTINATTIDDTSGVAYYNFYVNENIVSEKNESGTYTVTNLSTNASYTVYVEAVDNAGNTTTSTVIPATTEGKLLAPTIELSGTEGNNEYYTGNVTVTITDSASASETGTAQIKYTVNGATEQTVTGTTAEFTITADGTSTITAWVEDNSGNTSETSTKTVLKDATSPNAPTIETTTGTVGSNSWYTSSSVTVTITAGTDTTSGAYQIRYSISGATTVSQTTIIGTTQSITITADGTSTITAYTIDRAGNVSSATTYTVYKDATVPSTASLSVTSYGTSSITVRASGADATSGVYSYTFERSTNNSTFTTVTTVTSSSSSYSYTYSGLTDGTTYYLRVIVTDRAGNTLQSTTVTQATDTIGLSSTELAGKIGDYVAYTPTSGTFSAHTTSSYAGSRAATSNTEISTVTTLQWRILFVDDDTITLISDTTANSGFYLYAYNGYNNGVLLLNNACRALYSNSSLSATARSLNRDDLEEVSSYTHTTSSVSWNNNSTGEVLCYPSIFKSSLGASSQSSYYTGWSYDYTITARITDYTYTISNTYMSDIYVELFIYQAGTTTNLSNGYWLSTRGISRRGIFASLQYKLCEKRCSEACGSILYDRRR